MKQAHGCSSKKGRAERCSSDCRMPSLSSRSIKAQVRCYCSHCSRLHRGLAQELPHPSPPTCVRLSQAVGALKPVPARGMPNAPVACMGMVWACGKGARRSREVRADDMRMVPPMCAAAQNSVLRPPCRLEMARNIRSRPHHGDSGGQAENLGQSRRAAHGHKAARRGQQRQADVGGCTHVRVTWPQGCAIAWWQQQCVAAWWQQGIPDGTAPRTSNSHLFPDHPFPPHLVSSTTPGRSASSRRRTPANHDSSRGSRKKAVVAASPV